MRKINRSELGIEASDTHQVREFYHNGTDVIEHIFIGYNRDLDNKPINVLVWESGPAPRPFVHQQFRDGDDINIVRNGVQNAFDGIDWDWWRDRFAALEKAEQGIREEDEV